MKSILKDIGDLIAKTVAKAGEDNILTYGAAIAFYTIFSIAPLLILVVSVGSFFLSEEVVLTELRTIAGDYLDDEVIQNISSTIGERTSGGADLLKDRKSTRLNSSHVAISYAVFCLKKKTKDINIKYWSEL